MNSPDPNQQLLECRRCRRLSNQLKRLRSSHPDYWNRPVPGHGDSGSSLMIVGLAPGMHGANKTGIPFTGDASGDLLNDVLEALGMKDQIYITNAVKCLPISNLPSGREVQNCARYLAAEIETHGGKPHATLFALGGVAHRAVIRVMGLRQTDFPFAHGAVHDLGDLTLVDSYHCSRYNTQTGRLTREMFLDVMQTARDLAAGRKAA